jgi:hypothetical protein
LETNWQQRTQQLQRPFIHYIPQYWRNERSAMLAINCAMMTIKKALLSIDIQYLQASFLTFS